MLDMYAMHLPLGLYPEFKFTDHVAVFVHANAFDRLFADVKQTVIGV